MRELKEKCVSCGNGIMAKTKELWPEGYCQHCGETEYARRIKQWAVDYLGGKCQACGYDKYIGALQFHHRDPSQKRFRIGGAHQRTIESLRIELDKCDLLCANCHAELHERA